MRTLKTGDYVRLSEDIDLAPFGIVRAGQRGKVISKTPLGALEILMDAPQKALVAWGCGTLPITPMDGGVIYTLMVEDLERPTGFRWLVPAATEHRMCA